MNCINVFAKLRGEKKIYGKIKALFELRIEVAVNMSAFCLLGPISGIKIQQCEKSQKQPEGVAHPLV